MWTEVKLFINGEYEFSFKNVDNFDHIIDGIRKNREAGGWKTCYFGRTISSDKGKGNFVCLSPSGRFVTNYYWEYIK